MSTTITHNSKKTAPLTKISILGDTAGVVVGKTLGIAGVKEPENKFHAWGRTIAIILLFCIIAVSIYSEHQETVGLEDLNNVVKKNTILYNSILELDEDAQQKYLKSLKKTFEKEKPSLLTKYIKSIQIALIAGICSEYIINGNASKPIGIVGKTVVYTALMTTLATK